jgi:hypothetical protein
MHIHVESVLPASVGCVWAALQRTETLQHVAAPVLRFRAVEPDGLPSHWSEGVEANLRLYLFGFVPLGGHTIRLPVVDPDRGEIRSQESGRVAPVWNHTIRVSAVSDQATRYTDEVEIRAGVLTVFIWLFAHFFYRHRQRRWRKLLIDQRGG